MMNWTDARRTVPRLWIRSTEVRGEGVSLGEWEHTHIKKDEKFVFSCNGLPNLQVSSSLTAIIARRG